LIATALVVAGCVQATPAAQHAPAAQTAQPDRALSYMLRWSMGRATRDTTGWRVSTAMGYEVHVTAGALVNAAVQLVPCSSAGLFEVQVANADHGSARPDLTRWVGPRSESLVAPDGLTLGPVPISTDRYCDAHYLVADDPAANAPALRLAGTVRKGSGPARDFEITSPYPWGGSIKLPDGAIPASGDTQVVIERDLGGLFDEVDFEAAPDEQARMVLRALVRGTRVVAP
jgi:hypothetical protein